MPHGGNGHHRLRVTNKFGVPVSTLPEQVHCNLSVPPVVPKTTDADTAVVRRCIAEEDPQQWFSYLREQLASMDYDRLRWFVGQWASETAGQKPALGIEALTLGLDRRYPTRDKKRSSVLTILRGGLEQIFQRQPLCDGQESGEPRADHLGRP
jgi:hypothetical protein